MHIQEQGSTDVFTVIYLPVDLMTCCDIFQNQLNKATTET